MERETVYIRGLGSVERHSEKGVRKFFWREGGLSKAHHYL